VASAKCGSGGTAPVASLVSWSRVSASDREQGTETAVLPLVDRQRYRSPLNAFPLSPFPITATISEMTHFGVASVNRALVSLKEKNYISWISGRNSKKGGAVSNKYTLYLSGTPSQSDIPLSQSDIPLSQSDIPLSQSDIPPLSEREGQSITVIYPLSHSDRQKRIEKETNTNLTKEMAGLVGKSFFGIMWQSLG